MSRARLNKFEFSLDGAFVRVEFTGDRIRTLPQARRRVMRDTLLNTIFGEDVQGLESALERERRNTATRAGSSGREKELTPSITDMATLAGMPGFNVE